MKVTLDLARLQEDGRITAEEVVRLREMSSGQTRHFGLNILMGFGVIMAALGAIALFPSGWVSIGFGGVLLAASRAIAGRGENAGDPVLELMLGLVSCLMIGGGILWVTEGAAVGYVMLTVVSAVGAWMFSSGLLAAATALSLSGLIGSATAYQHASYTLIVSEPLLQIFLFSFALVGAQQGVPLLEAGRARVLGIFGRTCAFMVMYGFWVGSLWGDRRSGLPPDAFTLIWALVLIGIGWWGVARNDRWAVNFAAVFGSIHFYTQYFELLGAYPAAILVAGCIALAIAHALITYNQGHRVEVE